VFSAGVWRLCCRRNPVMP